MTEGAAQILSEIPDWKKFMSVSYVARLLGVHRRTVVRYIEAGKLEAVALPAGPKEVTTSLYRITKKDLENFLTIFSTDKWRYYSKNDDKTTSN